MNERDDALDGRPVDVLVSIVSHDQPDLLPPCLASLADACAGLRWRAEVTLNVPDPASERRIHAEFPGVGVHTNRVPLGFGANHNRVLRLAAAEGTRHVVVLNDDTVVAPGAVAALVGLLDRRPEVGAAAPQVRLPSGVVAASRLAYPTLAMGLRMDFGRAFERPDPDGWLQGAATAFRVEATEAVGGYDERYFLFFEDCDLSLRLRGAGWELASCPDAVVTHTGHATVLRPDLADATRLHGQRSRYLYYREHFGPARTAAVTTVGRLVLAARAVGNAARRRRALARQQLALARFDPRRPLPVEVAARGGEVAPS